MQIQDDGSGRPVRWDPCRPIHYVVRPDGGPPGGAGAIRTAIAEVGQLTGMRFVDDGPTSEGPSADRDDVDRARYGDRWSPVLIAWTDPEEFPGIAGFAGLGGPDAVGGRTPGRRRYVTGMVLLNREHLGQVVTWDRGQERLSAVVRHEFGHLVGLDHVGDPSELMFSQPGVDPSGFAEGDRRGLAELSGGPCFRDF
jgi:hypothetical protein